MRKPRLVFLIVLLAGFGIMGCDDDPLLILNDAPPSGGSYGKTRLQPDSAAADLPQHNPEIF